MPIVRLSRIDREVLLFSQLHADASATAIAKKAKCREHTVRRSLAKLEESGAIQRYPYINIYPLGFAEYGIFFSLTSGKKQRTKLLATLEEMDRVAWILELGGDFQFGVALCARGAGEIIDIFDSLSAQFGEIFFEKSIAVRTGWHLFPRRYLSPTKIQDGPLSCGRTSESRLSAKKGAIAPGPTVKLDELDHLILSTLSSARYHSYRELARMLSVPHTTLLHRMKLLAELGVLRGFAYGIDASVFGMQTYRLLIYMKQVSLAAKHELHEFCTAHRNVFAFIECLGSWDFEVKVEVETSAQLTEVMELLYERFGSALQTIKVLTVLRTRKLEFYPFRTLPTETLPTDADGIPLQPRSKKGPNPLRIRHFD